MGTMSRKDSTKRAQQRADVALPIASDLSQSQRGARRRTARSSQTTAKRKAAFDKLKKEAKPAGSDSSDLITRIRERKEKIKKALNG